MDTPKKDHLQKKTRSNATEGVRMNVNLTKSFYKRIKQRALNEDKTVKEIVIQALEDYLSK